MTTFFDDLLVCPVCKGKLLASDEGKSERICPRCQLAFEVRQNIPVMIKDRARPLTADEVERYHKKPHSSSTL
jgi:uncharacterized protein YbaR (Trm112 family)